MASCYTSIIVYTTVFRAIAEDKKEPFMELHRILGALRLNDIDPALW
jgi:hypothetical protein